MGDIVEMRWVGTRGGLVLQYRQRRPVFDRDGAQVGWGPWAEWVVPQLGPGVVAPPRLPLPADPMAP